MTMVSAVDIVYGGKICIRLRWQSLRRALRPDFRPRRKWADQAGAQDCTLPPLSRAPFEWHHEFQG